MLKQFSPTAEGKHPESLEHGLHTPIGIKTWAGTEHPGAGAAWALHLRRDTYLGFGKNLLLKSTRENNKSTPLEKLPVTAGRQSSWCAVTHGRAGKGKHGWAHTKGHVCQPVRGEGFGWCCRTRWLRVCGHQWAERPATDWEETCRSRRSNSSFTRAPTSLGFDFFLQ